MQTLETFHSAVLKEIVRDTRHRLGIGGVVHVVEPVKVSTGLPNRSSSFRSDLGNCGDPTRRRSTSATIDGVSMILIYIYIYNSGILLTTVS